MISAAIGIISMAVFWVVLWLVDRCPRPRGGFTVGDQIRLGEELHRIVSISGTTLTITREAGMAFQKAGMSVQEFSNALSLLGRARAKKRTAKYVAALTELRRCFYGSNAIEVSQEYPLSWFDGVPLEVGGRLYGCTLVRIADGKVLFRVP